MLTRKRARRLSFLLAGLITLLLLFILPMTGRNWIGPDAIFSELPWHGLSGLSADARIYWGERFPKTLLAMVAGSGLALCGMVLQAVFRNPLATPYTLGIAGGSAFGASVAIVLGGAGGVMLLGIPWATCGALLGAILAMSVVFLLSGRNDLAGDRMLLAGVAVSFFFTSLTLCVQYIADPTQSFRIVRWTMGGIDHCDARHITLVATTVGSGAVFLATAWRELNLMLLGRDEAMSLGLNVTRFRYLLFIVTSLMVGVIVSVCGPIGFVGIMVPHCARLLVGGSHDRLFPLVLFGGALFLGACYTISRIILYPVILPTGVLTSLLGGPFFLWILFRKK
ncbi:MAG: iron ABC transporter permease [Planctomycetia bacterium]|nr:iron ABC transporter permease [Planctomycetia bacterium]